MEEDSNLLYIYIYIYTYDRVELRGCDGTTNWLLLWAMRNSPMEGICARKWV